MSDLKLVPPPMTSDQAELFILSKAPPGGVFFIPFGQMIEPIQGQAAFERLLMREDIRLADVNAHMMPAVGNHKPQVVMVRFFMLTTSGVQRLAVLRGTVQMN